MHSQEELREAPKTAEVLEPSQVRFEAEVEELLRWWASVLEAAEGD